MTGAPTTLTNASRARIIFAMMACYFLFAVLLNSVGTVILQSINTFDVSKTQAAGLEGFKDLSIAIMSFLVASMIPRFGYKLALLGALAAVTLVCLITPQLGQFYAFKLLFAVVGCAFAVVKISVYALVGQLSDSPSSHSALLNTIEGMFMVGVLSGYWIFSFFITDEPAALNWLNVYYILALLSLVCCLSIVLAPIKKQALPPGSSIVSEFTAMLKLSYQPLVLVFIISAFLYVLIEQGVGTWLPTFNNKILHLPVDVSVQLTSIFAASLAVGRLLAGQILKVCHWYTLLNVCLLAMGALILLTLPLTKNVSAQDITSVFKAPLAAYLMPMIGLFMAPIYPVLNSVILSSLAKHQQASMTGMIVIFSALGGTTGSILTGYIFEHFSGQHAFYCALVPLCLLIVSVYLFKQRSTPAQAVAA
ncbi:MFS transporter [Pseudoalteromonas sp. JBTF-M23]|uniref:MFS transporter n=1 Tax=Pseudoalteromonas caenipelagi TaxID=2726988 RepID=A0A849VDK2_9GAMM|nr:MFS transporter [Pseudoalteromonas caenipelagi]NOU50014.1 MFS transporter [Pseudoalteromonas caenipelagi]